MRFDNDFAQRRLVRRGESELVQRQKNLAARQQAERHALPVNRRHRRYADVNFLAFDADIDAAVLRQALFGDVHSRHDFDAGNNRRLKALELRRHRRLVQNAVNAVTNAQLVFGRLEVDVGRAVLVSFPDDLVDELDDARFLVAFGDFLVFGDEQLNRLVLGHFIEGFGANSVIFFQRLFNFVTRRERELDWTLGVELHRVQHRGVERVADSHLERAVFKLGGEDEVLKRHFRGDFLARLGRHR